MPQVARLEGRYRSHTPIPEGTSQAEAFRHRDDQSVHDHFKFFPKHPKSEHYQTNPDGSVPNTDGRFQRERTERQQREQENIARYSLLSRQLYSQLDARQPTGDIPTQRLDAPQPSRSLPETLYASPAEPEPSRRPASYNPTTPRPDSNPVLRTLSPGGRNWDFQLHPENGHLRQGEMQRIEQARGKTFEVTNRKTIIHDLRTYGHAQGWTLLADPFSTKEVHPPLMLRAQSPGGRNWKFRLHPENNQLRRGETQRIGKKRGTPIEGANPSDTIRNLRIHGHAHNWTLLEDPFPKPR
jgi:hypothetical protein